MKKHNDMVKTSARKEIKSVDIPWWIGGPKIIAAPAREKRNLRSSW